MPTRLPNDSITLQEVGILPTLAYFPFLGRKWVHVRVSYQASFTTVRLGEDMELPQEERGLHLSEGVRLGEGMFT